MGDFPPAPPWLRAWELYLVLYQHGPTAFDLQAILQKRDDSRSTSNKLVYKTTNSQSLLSAVSNIVSIVHFY